MFRSLTPVIFLAFLTILCARTAATESTVCGSVYTKKQFLLRSPNYSSAYPPQQRCSYYFKGDSCGTYYVLQLLDFHLQNSAGCIKSRLEIGDQDALCGTNSGVKTYFSPNGDLNVTFISDSTYSRFTILVTRLPCSSGAPQGSTPGPFNHRSLPDCCISSYGLRNFYISSPGFPYSSPPSTDCVYNIRKANINVCRLRISFLYFNSGAYDAEYGSCTRGYVEIDGKKICGCQTGLKLTTSFEGDGLTKTIRFKNEDVLANELKGFLIEIVQDECPKKYESYNVVKHVYYFVSPDEVPDANDTTYNPGVIDPRGVRRDREETAYLDTSSFDSDGFDGNDKSSCEAWKYSGIPLLSRETLWKSMVPCGPPKVSSGPIARKCVQLNSAKGYFQSPGYPYYYPSNLNLCYR